MADNALLVFSTFPDVATARRIGRELVEQRCAALRQHPAADRVDLLVGEEGRKRDRDAVLFKTSAERYQALESTLRRLHPTTFQKSSRCGYCRPAGIPELGDRELYVVARIPTGCCRNVTRRDRLRGFLPMIIREKRTR
jgi:uncharacterized protein involved in tolerance to divalent cations